MALLVIIYLFALILQTLEYFEHLKSVPDGWKVCAADFTQKLHRYAPCTYICTYISRSQVIVIWFIIVLEV